MTSWEQEGERERKKKKARGKKSANNFQVHFDFSAPNKAILR